MRLLSIFFIVISFTLFTAAANAQFSGSDTGRYNLETECGNDICEIGENLDNCPDDCIIGGSIEIDTNYEFVKNSIIPVIATGGECTNPWGCPNFTKTMSIKFNAKGTIKRLINEKCTDTKCSASYRFNDDPGVSMAWDPFSFAFTAERGSNDLECNKYHILRITMTSADASGRMNEKIYINCELRMTLNPAERRLAVGEKNKLGFLLNVWNPTADVKIYNIEIKPTPNNEFVATWLRFECGPVPQCQVDRNILTVTTPAVDSKEVQVMLTDEASSIAGIYPVDFADNAKNLHGEGTLLVFAEGLSEFQAWQLVVLLLASLVIFFIVGKEGTRKSKALSV